MKKVDTVKPRKLYDCGICGAYHLSAWDGDCQDDSARIHELRDTDEVVVLCRECGGEDGHDPFCGQNDYHAEISASVEPPG